MSIALLFWIIMLVWLIFGLWSQWPAGGPTGIGNVIVLWILLALLGWHVFGPALHA